MEFYATPEWTQDCSKQSVACLVEFPLPENGSAVGGLNDEPGELSAPGRPGGVKIAEVHGKVLLLDGPLHLGLSVEGGEDKGTPRRPRRRSAAHPWPLAPLAVKAHDVELT